MLTRGSLLTIFEELDPSEQVVACFCNISRILPPVDLFCLCRNSPKWLSHPLVDFMFEVRPLRCIVFCGLNEIMITYVPQSFKIVYDSHGNIELIRIRDYRHEITHKNNLDVILRNILNSLK